jgi:creatinine amidohydrolase
MSKEKAWKPWFQELTWEEVAEYLKKNDIVIVPIGSTEVHGPHLPLGVDSYEAIDYAEEIAKRARVLITPHSWFGYSPHHMGKAGTISLRAETIIGLLTDIYTSLIKHGFRNIITFNGHRLANLPVIQIAAKNVKESYPEVTFSIMDPVVMAHETHKALCQSPGAGNHGGEFETSHMLYRHPELVKNDKFSKVTATHIESRFVNEDAFVTGDKIFFIVGAEDQKKATPFGHVGDPTVSSVEKGKRIFEAVVNNGAEFIEHLRQHSKKK